MKNDKGFTLIELLVAVTILYLILPSFFNFLTKTIFNTKFSVNYSIATVLCEKKLEQLMYKNFNNSDLTDSLTGNNNNLNPISIDKNQILNNFTSYVQQNFDHYQIVNKHNTRFYIFWNIADVNSYSSVFTHKVIVVITYWISQGRGHKIVFETVRRST